MSKVVRNELFASAEYAYLSTATALASLARMVLDNNLRAATAVMRKCGLARSHITVVGNKVCFVNASAFDLAFAVAKDRAVGGEIAALETLIAADIAPQSASRRLN